MEDKPDFAPLSSSLSTSSAVGGSPAFTLTNGIRYIYFNKDAKETLDISESDRVGLIIDKNNPFHVYMYFTNNTIGTYPVKKYVGYPYRVDSAKICHALMDAFKLTTPGVSIKVYINLGVSINLNVNGRSEICYMLSTSVSERTDIDDFLKEAISEEYRKIIQGAKK